MRPAVLVVEDDAATRTLLNVVLSRAGFDVDVVPNGSDALPLLESVPYSVMTFDLYMRGVSGHDLLAHVVSNRPSLLNRIIVVSSAPAAELALLREHFAGVRVLRKPFDLDDLLGALRGAAEGAEPVVRDPASEFCRRSVLCGAKSGVALTVKPEAAQLDVALSFGYPKETLRRFFPVSIEEHYPVSAAYRLQRSVWISSTSAAEAEYPLLGGVWREHRSYALAAVPLALEGRPIGAIGWAFREPRAFDDVDRQRFEEIAAQVATELGRAPATTEAG